MDAYFTRGTTPSYQFDIKGTDISDWDHIYLSFQQFRQEVVRIENPAVEPTDEGFAVTGTLTQEQTLAFAEGGAEAQVRCVKGSVAAANAIKFPFTVYGVIMDGVIPKED